MALSNLVWSDLFVAPTPEWSWYKATPGATFSTPVPAVCHEEIAALRAYLESVASANVMDLDVEWQGMALRLNCELVANNIKLFILRRFVLSDLNLRATGLQTGIISTLMSDSDMMKSGIVAFIGSPGSGKSTLARSFVIDRLMSFGGTAWTIECPIEQPIQGKYGNGWLYQIGVKSDDEIGPKIERLYRAVPNIIMVSEVRNARTAREVLRAAGSGYLVVITFHGNDVLGAIRQFVEQTSSNKSEMLSASIADVLRAVVHVQLNPMPLEQRALTTSIVDQNARGTGNPSQALSARAIFFTEKDDSARSILRKGEFTMLSSVIDRQRRQLMAGQTLV